MKKSLVITAALFLAIGILVGMAAMSFSLYRSPAAKASGGMTIHVVEHAITDTVGDVPPKGDSMGDQLAFHNPVFDATDSHQVGHDNGNCVRTVVSTNKKHPNGVWECYWTVFLKDGQITVEGPYYDNGNDSTLAITGGTGAYFGAQGQMTLHARGNPVGSEYDFIYMLG